ncbi:hypothetical protein, variant 2 [Capsaspora owczarzaki ATCC 30864]|nr:hypothetical protein, variant 2 [Capsaspora owczarzaki ATCC 30864]
MNRTGAAATLVPSSTKLKPSLLVKQNKGVQDRQRRDAEARAAVVAMNREIDPDALVHSRAALEAKAAIYDRIHRGEGSSAEQQKSDRYLVDFEVKSFKPRVDNHTSQDELVDPIQLGEAAFGDPDEQVEFVDYLGRTRTCRRAELPQLLAADRRDRLHEIKSSDRSGNSRRRRRSNSLSDEDESRRSPRRDDDRYAAVPPPSSTGGSEDTYVCWVKPVFFLAIFLFLWRVRYESVMIDSHLLLKLPPFSNLKSRPWDPSKRDYEDRRHRPRSRWDEQQSEQPTGPIHFETVRSGEIRTLGAGYYQFSTDATERQLQLDSLKALHQQTLEQRKKREGLSKLRESMIARRLEMIHQRKEAKLQRAQALHLAGDDQVVEAEDDPATSEQQSDRFAHSEGPEPDSLANRPDADMSHEGNPATAHNSDDSSDSDSENQPTMDISQLLAFFKAKAAAHDASQDE